MFTPEHFSGLGSVRVHVVYTDAQHSHKDCLNCSLYFCETMNRRRAELDALMSNLWPAGVESQAAFTGYSSSVDASQLPSDFVFHAHARSTIDAWEAKTGDHAGAQQARANWESNAVLVPTRSGPIHSSISIDLYHHSVVGGALTHFETAQAQGSANQLLQDVRAALD